MTSVWLVGVSSRSDEGLPLCMDVCVCMCTFPCVYVCVCAYISCVLVCVCVCEKVFPSFDQLTLRLYALGSWLKQSSSTPPSSIPCPRARRDSSLWAVKRLMNN